MSKHQIKPKSKLQTGNHTNPDVVEQRKNIFQLIEPINKTRSSISTEIRNKFDFAENLITFLQEKHPEELSKLSFDPEYSDINTLISELIKPIIDLGYKIVFDDEAGDTAIKILYSLDYDEWMWYLFEYSWVDEIPSEELKIGFTHLMNHIAENCYVNVFKYDYFETDDNAFESEFDMLIERELYLDDEDNVDEGQVQEAQEEAAGELNRLRGWKEKFLNYYHQPLSKFLEYNPESEHQKAFKKFIIKGMNLDYQNIFKFMPWEDVINNGGLSFDASLLMAFDVSAGVEEQFFEALNEDANNGNSSPAGWYSVNNGEVQNMTTPEDIQELKENFQYIIDLYENHLNKMKEWNT